MFWIPSAAGAVPSAGAAGTSAGAVPSAGAAGAAEAIVCVKALNEQIAPPTINYLEPDPDCDLDYTPNKAREGHFEAALSSSLGFGGHNACLAFRRNGGEE